MYPGTTDTPTSNQLLHWPGMRNISIYLAAWLVQQRISVLMGCGFRVSSFRVLDNVSGCGAFGVSGFRVPAVRASGLLGLGPGREGLCIPGF